MSLVTRYFSTTSAGAGDGTTWADRAALFSTGNWSSVLTGFDFSGSDSLTLLIGPGTYTCSQSLASGLFSHAPTAGNPLFLHGCDSSGNKLSPSNPAWTSAQPVDWDSSLPVIATSTNIVTANLANCYVRLLKFTASGASGNVLVSCGLDWVVVVNSQSDTSAAGVALIHPANNVSVVMSGTAYENGANSSNSAAIFDNFRIQGNPAASSGNRRAYLNTAFSGGGISRFTIFNHAQRAVDQTGSSTSGITMIKNCVIANNGSDGIRLVSTASQTGYRDVSHNIITGNGGYGINAQSAANVVAANNRLRDNTSGNFGGMRNYPTDTNYTTDSDDASEFVDATNGDYRIKAGSAIHGKGYGVSDEASSGGGGGRRMRGRYIGT